MYIEIGPASLTVSGEKGGRAYPFERAEVEETVRRVLGEIKDYLPLLRQKACRIRNTRALPPTVRSMVEAAKSVDGESLTSMAAVAGAVSHALMGRLKEDGLDLVSVNNGGDIAIWNRTGKTLRVGVGDIGTGKWTPYAIRVTNVHAFGVATSGLGGRSHTLGLADLCTVMGPTAALADAAATFLGNRTNVESDRVIRKRASELDPLTDIPEEFVTIEVGELEGELVEKALGEGLHAAERLKATGVIYDALIVMKGKMVSTMGSGPHIRLEVQDGSEKDRHHS